jgi:hypothetical protein
MCSLLLAVVAPQTACSDFMSTSVKTDSRLDEHARFEVLAVDTAGPFCPAVDDCALVQVEGETACMCQIEGIGVNVPGGPGYPGCVSELAEPARVPAFRSRHVEHTTGWWLLAEFAAA